MSDVDQPVQRPPYRLCQHCGFVARDVCDEPRMCWRAPGDLADFTRYPDEALLLRAVTNARAGRGRHWRWTAVMRAFGVGSRTAQALCLRFGLDPEEEVK